MNKSNYFRATVYNEQKNYCAILDVCGLYEKDWQFTYDLIKKGFSVLECSDGEIFIECDLKMTQEAEDKLVIRAKQEGKPKYDIKQLRYGTYAAIKVGDKVYVPSKYEKDGGDDDEDDNEEDVF